MRWQRARLWALEDTGERDAVNDRVLARADLGDALVRATPSGGTLAESEGNRYEDAPATFVTPAPMATVRRAALAELGGEEWRVVGSSDLGRMRSLSLQRQRGGGDG